MKGLREYKAVGLLPPERVRTKTKEYRDDQDILFDFLHETCIMAQNQTLDLHSPGLEESASKLYNRYTEWCAAERLKREDILSSVKFGKILLERGFQRDRKTSGKVYIGLKLKTSG